MSMEAFLAQVVWPEVQPSFLGGGEAPAAQKPQTQAPGDAEDTPADTTIDQAVEDDMPEARDTEETLAATPIEIIEEGGAIDTDIDEDYVENVTAVQGTWDP